MPGWNGEYGEFGRNADHWLAEPEPDATIGDPASAFLARFDGSDDAHLTGCTCLACCDDGTAFEAAASGGHAAAAQADLPSLGWDEAAEQIGRSDRVFGAGTSGISLSDHLGRGATVTYGFLAEADAQPDTDRRDFRALTQAEIASVETAIARIAAVIDVEFVRVTGTDGTYLSDPDDAQIDLDGIAGSNGGLARTAYTGNAIVWSDVSLGERGLETEGAYAFRSALHEISHALGLSHPGDYNGGSARSYAQDASFREDSAQFSVMSYWDETATGAQYGQAHASHLMLYDIAALQRLYGANETARGDDDVYGTSATDAAWSLAGGAPVGAIWDTGGHDRIDGSGHEGDQRIDLREEAFSSLGGLTGNVAIARGTVIEDATGGAGDDVLVGNDFANVLIGGAGSDLIEGGAGDDVIYGDGWNGAWDDGGLA